MGAQTVYVIDTSSLVDLHRWRPVRKHPGVWKHLIELIETDRLIAPNEVYEEIRENQDALYRWAQRWWKEGKLFEKSTRRYAGIAKQIIHRFPALVDLDQPTPQADPFIIALAVRRKKTDDLFTTPPIVTVVTEETYRPTGRPKIPNVCAAFEVRYVSIHQMYVNEGWKI